MRFALAHKLTTYLAVASAFFAIALSGELAPPALLPAFAAILASWYWEPPRVRFERWTRWWTGLSVVVFAAAVALWLAGLDILIVGAHFLLYLLVAKLFARRAAKDYQQVYVLTFLMLVAGTVLNAGFSYGLFFLGYVVFVTWALILFHLRREMEENFLLKHSGSSSQPVQVARILSSKRIVGPRFFVGTGLISLLVFLGATMLFLAIPRIGLGLFFPKRRQGVNLAGFEETVKLGGHGTIKDDPTVVMRVYVDDAYAGRKAPALHWRGIAFDKYERGQWFQSPIAPRSEVDIDVIDRTRVHMRYDRFSQLSREEIEGRMAQGLRQTIYLEPMGTDVLFGASMPLIFEFGTLRTKEKVGLNDELRHPHGAGLRYVVYSDPERPPAAMLREAPTTLPNPGVVARPDDRGKGKTYRAYLQTPQLCSRAAPAEACLPDRVADKARELTRNAPTWYDKAVAIEAFLRTELDYTLTMQSPPAGQDPIDFFLFDRRRGHCEYFSSAMTIMLRTVGVPTRNVNGFLGGAWNEYGDYIAVRGGDAHSWVEVYFPTIGWVTFDPTPPTELDQLGRGGAGVLDKLQRMLDTLRLKWFQWVIEYDLQQQLRLFKSLRGTFSSARFKGGFKAAKRWMSAHKRTTIAVVLAALAVASIIVWLRRRRRALAPLVGERPLTRSQSAIANVYLSLQAKLARRGYRRAEAATPREHAAELRRRAMPGAANYDELTELYYDAVYGQREQPEALQRARYLRDAIHQAWRARRQRQIAA